MTRILIAFASDRGATRQMAHAVADGVGSVPEGLVVEVVSHFTRVADGCRVAFPCVDIYRTRGGRIADWRVFADMSPFDGRGPRDDAQGAGAPARASARERA